MSRVLFRGGLLADGTGAPLRRGDLLIENDRIAAIDPAGDIAGAQIIEADGKIVCPAFIDIHRHVDAKPLLNSDMQIELRQGIATTVSGNCGFSLAPGGGAFAQEKRANDLPILGAYPETFQFSFPEYLDALEKSHPALNVAAMIGLGAVRISLNGFSAQPLSQKQLDAGAEMISDALAAGAAGVSAGIMYLPEFYTQPHEYRALLRPMRGGRKPLVTHIRGEGDSLIASIDEVLRIAREAECPLEISHFKSCGMQNWNRDIHIAIERIESARAAGQDVTVDFYPYLGGSTALTTMLPPAFVQGDMPAALVRLGTPEGVDALRAACAVNYSDWDNYALTLGWDRILIASAEGENRRFLGMSVQEAAEKFGFDDAVALAAHLMHSENGRTAIINLSMDQRDVDTIARLGYSTLISDAIYADTDTPHPRLYGAFPRFIQDYVRKRRVLTLPEAIRKMTSMPADRMQIAHRGRLQSGNFADILMFDAQALSSKATFSSATHMGEGVSMLMINGEICLKDDRLTGIANGRTLRI